MRGDNIEPITFRRVLGDDEVTLYVNPQQIQITSRKVFSRVMTNTRWVFHHWGREPYIISCTGLTGSLIPATGTSDPFEKSSVYQTQAYRTLKKLESFYSEPALEALAFATDSTTIANSIKKILVQLKYRRDIYVGFFSSFSFRELETSPWAWTYSFEFVGTYKTTVGVSHSAEALVQRFLEKFGEFAPRFVK